MEMHKSYLCHDFALVVLAVRLLPIEARRSRPSLGQRTPILYTAGSPSGNHIAAALSAGSAAGDVIGRAPVNDIPGRLRILQADDTGCVVRISPNPGVCMIDAKEFVHLQN